MFTIPAYTALVTLADVKLDYHPQLVVSNVGSDPTTLTGLLKAFSKGKAGGELIDGIVTDTYLPPIGTRRTSGSRCSSRSTTSTSRSCRSTATSGYGFALAYTFAEALQRGRQPDPPGARRHDRAAA